MSPEAAREILNLGRALGELLHSSGVPLSSLGVELGYHDQYLSRALRGTAPLKVEVVFQILKAVSIRPDEFLEEMYPFGGPAMEAMVRARHPRYREDELMTSLHGAVRRKCTPDDWLPGELALRTGRSLAELLALRGITQQQVSEGIGLGRSALGQALRGSTQLLMGHVFGALAYAKIPIGRLWKEVFGPGPADPLARMRWRRALDTAEEAVSGVAVPLAARRGLLTKPKRAKPMAEGSGKPRPAKPKGKRPRNEET